MARFNKKVDQQQQRLPLSYSSKKESRWHNFQKRQKARQWIRRITITLGAFFVLGLVVSVFRLGWWLGQPLSQAQFAHLESPQWTGKSQLNLLINVASDALDAQGSRVEAQGGQFLLASLHPVEGTLKILTFPADLKIPDTKGNYTLFELLVLAKVQNPPQGVDFVISSLEKYLAVPVDGYLVASVTNSKLEKVITEYHRQLQSPLAVLQVPKLVSFIKQELKTNLTPGQLFRALWEGRGVRFDRVEIFEFKGFGSRVEQDAYIRKIFEDPQLLKERLRISVKNGSDIPGLAAATARFIENLGGEVVEIQNSKFKIQNSKIRVYSAPKGSLTVKRLEDVLEVKAEWVEAEEVQRADVEVVVAD